MTWQDNSGSSHDAVIRVYGADSNVIETHELKGDFKEVVKYLVASHHNVKIAPPRTLLGAAQRFVSTVFRILNIKA